MDELGFRRRPPTRVERQQLPPIGLIDPVDPATHGLDRLQGFQYSQCWIDEVDDWRGA